MPGEARETTLLRFEADASDVERAAADAQVASDRLYKEALRDSTHSAEASNQILETYRKQVLAASEGTDDLSDATGRSRQEAQAFAMAVGRVSPELGGLISLATRAKDAFAFMFTPLGASIATVAALAAAIREVKQEAEEAQRHMEAMYEANRKLGERTRETTEEVADVMARAGVVGQPAISAAQAIKGQMAAQGFKPEAIRKVLPLALGKGGEEVLTREEREALAAQEEFEPGELDFAKPREIPRVRQRALRTVERNAEMIAVYRQAIADRVYREDRERLAGGDRAALGRMLEKEGIPEEEMAQSLQDIEDVARKGRISLEGSWHTVDDDTRRLEFERRQSAAADRARRAGMITGKQRQRAASEEFRGGGPLGQVGREPMGRFGFMPAPAEPAPAPAEPDLEPSFGGHGGGASWDEEPTPAPAAQPRKRVPTFFGVRADGSVDPEEDAFGAAMGFRSSPATQPAGVVNNIFNHGTMIMKPNENARPPSRIQRP